MMLQLKLAGRLVIYICCVASTFFAAAQKTCTNVVLKGKISNADGEWLYIKQYDYKTFTMLDSVRVENGAVSIKLPFVEPQSVMLICNKARANPLVNCGVNLFTWDVTDQTTFAMKNGINEYYDSYMKKIQNPITDQMVELSKQRRAQKDNQSFIDSLNSVQHLLQDKLSTQNRTFIWQNSKNFVSLFMLRYYYPTYPVDTVKAMYANLSNDLKRFPSAKKIKEFLDLEMKHMPLNELTYTCGKDSVAGFNYYVVDFWGSWCGPCIAAIPTIKELYKQHRPRNIQFVSLAFEKAKDLVSYNNAQEKLAMPWPQAYLMFGNDNTLMEKYHISQFPTYMILDKNFKIRHRLITHEELKEKLQKL